MNYNRLAFAQQVLRAASGQPIEKAAGLVGGLSAVAGHVAKHPIAAAGTALSGLGMYQIGKSSIQRGKAYNAGFNPAVHQALQTPIG